MKSADLVPGESYYVNTSRDWNHLRELRIARKWQVLAVMPLRQSVGRSYHDRDEQPRTFTAFNGVQMELPAGYRHPDPDGRFRASMTVLARQFSAGPRSDTGNWSIPQALNAASIRLPWAEYLEVLAKAEAEAEKDRKRREEESMLRSAKARKIRQFLPSVGFEVKPNGSVTFSDVDQLLSDLAQLVESTTNGLG